MTWDRESKVQSICVTGKFLASHPPYPRAHSDERDNLPTTAKGLIGSVIREMSKSCGIH